MPAGIRFDLFDMAVNSGVKAAIRTLARSAGARWCARALTLQAVQSTDPMRIAVRFNAQRLVFMASLPNWPAFGRG